MAVAAAPADPVTADEAAALFAGLDRSLAIAVSGGVDSMALLHLIARWRTDGGGTGLAAPLVLTVDHGLRTGSAGDAAFVAGQALRLGLAHETLVWRAAKPATGIQAAARLARYDLLLDRLARDAERRDLLLAHTLDDQAETLLMRLARGSGLDGLSAMPAITQRVVVMLEHPVREVAIRLRRPLLGVPKARLAATLQSNNGAWRDDPSNADATFERVRLRAAAPAASALGLTPAALARSAARLGAERSAALVRAQAIAATCLDAHGGAWGTLTVPTDGTLPASDATRVLARLLDVFGGHAPAARLSQIETLTNEVLTPGARVAPLQTLGGCLVAITVTDRSTIQIDVCRETGRAPLEVRTLVPGTAVFWDRRFYVSLASGAPASVTIGPGGGARSDAMALVDAGLAPAARQWARRSRAGLPAVLTDGRAELLAVGQTGHLTCTWPPQHTDALRFRDPA
jgi:tRNA(Ile)-lysidine synthase